MITVTELAERVRQGLGRNQAVVGDDPVRNLVIHGNAGLVWVCADLGHQKQRRLRQLCEKKKVPFLVLGESSEVDLITGTRNTRVYGLRQRFSGLNALLAELDTELS